MMSQPQCNDRYNFHEAFCKWTSKWKVNTNSPLGVGKESFLVMNKRAAEIQRRLVNN
jgi:hypothetical protein